jgi:hypothetical protein
MKNAYLLVIFLLTTACKGALSPGAPVASPSPEASIAFHIAPGSVAIDEISSGDSLTPDLVMNEALIENGFVIFGEKITSFSSSPVSIQISFSSSGFQLYTRIQEHLVSSSMGTTGLNKSPSKLSTLNLAFSELVVSHSDGSTQRLSLSQSPITFNLAANEVVNLQWIIRGSPDSVICPFHSSLNWTQPMVSLQGNWSLLGSSLRGGFNRTVQAQVQDSSGASQVVPLVSAQDVPSNLQAGNGIASPGDIDFGCNGFMEKMN